MRSLLTTDEFFDLTRPIPLLLTLAKTARANKVAAFIAAFMKNATNVLGNLTLPGHTAGAYNTDRICIPEVIKMLHERFVHVGKTLRDLQILGCELH